MRSGTEDARDDGCCHISGRQYKRCRTGAMATAEIMVVSLRGGTLGEDEDSDDQGNGNDPSTDDEQHENSDGQSGDEDEDEDEDEGEGEGEDEDQLVISQGFDADEGQVSSESSLPSSPPPLPFNDDNAGDSDYLETSTPEPENKPTAAKDRRPSKQARKRARSEMLPSILQGQDQDQGCEATPSGHPASVATSPEGPRPFKRLKGVMNPPYISLLNEDIEDARDMHVSYDWPPLPASQIGLTFWSPTEKNLLFEALSRLGRHRPDLIARRLRRSDPSSSGKGGRGSGKSELEVRQYLDLLEQARASRRREGQLEVVPLHEFPAAVEIGPECAAALDEAADALALRQEAHEEAAAERYHGGYVLTQANCAAYVKEALSHNYAPSIHPLQFFSAANWLRLPERLFMNARFEENNWRSVSAEPPSVRVSVLDDFYSIVVALTRKLMGEALFNARMSARARGKGQGPITVKRAHVPSPSQVVTVPHHPGERGQFWAECARRLRLDVVDDENEDRSGGQGEDGEFDEFEAMSYEEVESRLSEKSRTKHEAEAEAEAKAKAEDEGVGDAARNSDEDTTDDDDAEAEEEENYRLRMEDNDNDEAEVGASSDPDNGREGEPDDISISSISTISDADPSAEVEREVDEVLVHSALGFPATARAKNGLRQRIRAEMEREALADAVDRRASYVEERRLWDQVLRRKPTVPPQRVPDPLREGDRNEPRWRKAAGRKWRGEVADVLGIDGRVRDGL